MQYRLQCLRGLLALLVVISHLSHWTNVVAGKQPNPHLVSIGAFSVAVFFVISGYIIGFIHNKDIGKPVEIKSFLTKRIFRIYPAYITFLLLTIIASAAGLTLPKNHYSANNSIFDYLSSLTLYPFIPHSTSSLIVAWSLYYEILFYIVFSFLILNRRLGYFILGSFILVSVFNRNDSLTSIFCINKINILFATGLLISSLSTKIQLNWKIYISAGISGFLLLAKATIDLASLNSVTVYVGATLIVAAISGLDIHYPLKSKGPLLSSAATFGAISYSLYLGHIFGQSLAFHFLGPPATALRIAIYIIIPISLALASYKFIELPTMRWSRRFLEKDDKSIGSRTAQYT